MFLKEVRMFPFLLSAVGGARQFQVYSNISTLIKLCITIDMNFKHV